LVFSRERVKFLRSHDKQVHGALVMVSEKVRPGTLRGLRREYMAHDEDGNELGVRREQVYDGTGDGRAAVRFTIIAVETLDVYEGRGLTLSLAKGCGHQTVRELRAMWLKQHPQSPLAKAIYFALGDWRDQDRFLQRYIHRGGDYTGNRTDAIDDLPALTPAQLGELGAVNRQKDVRRKADSGQKLSEQPLSVRMALIEAAGERMRVDMNPQLKSITYHASKADKALGEN
jgi:hypothetical protein